MSVQTDEVLQAQMDRLRSLSFYDDFGKRLALLLRDIIDSASGGGGRATPTLDEVLAEGGTLVADRTISVNGHLLRIDGSGATQLAEFTDTGFTAQKVAGLFFNDGGFFRMIDTATSAAMNVVITNGAFVITPD